MGYRSNPRWSLRAPHPIDLDVACPLERQHHLAPDVAMFYPTLSNANQIIDLVTGDYGTGYNLTHADSNTHGKHHTYNGSSSYAFFGANDRYAINSGGITLSLWFKSAGWGSGGTIISRRYTPANDWLNYLVNQQASGKCAVAYTVGQDSYQIWQTSSTLASLGAFDGNWHLLVVSWTFGLFSSTATLTLDGVSHAGSITLASGADGNHSPQPGNEQLAIGANWQSVAPSVSSYAAAEIGPVGIYRRQLPAAQHQELWLPQTRWSMLRARNNRFYSIPAPPPDLDNPIWLGRAKLKRQPATDLASIQSFPIEQACRLWLFPPFNHTPNVATNLVTDALLDTTWREVENTADGPAMLFDGSAGLSIPQQNIVGAGKYIYTNIVHMQLRIDTLAEQIITQHQEAGTYTKTPWKISLTADDTIAAHVGYLDAGAYTDLESTTTISAGEWFTLTLSHQYSHFDSPDHFHRVALFINGILEAEDDITSFAFGIDDPIEIGNDGLVGAISEFKLFTNVNHVWDCRMTDADLADLSSSDRNYRNVRYTDARHRFILPDLNAASPIWTPWGYGVIGSQIITAGPLK